MDCLRYKTHCYPIVDWELFMSKYLMCSLGLLISNCRHVHNFVLSWECRLGDMLIAIALQGRPHPHPMLMGVSWFNKSEALSVIHASDTIWCLWWHTVAAWNMVVPLTYNSKVIKTGWLQWFSQLRKKFTCWRFTKWHPKCTYNGNYTKTAHLICYLSDYAWMAVSYDSTRWCTPHLIRDYMWWHIVSGWLSLRNKQWNVERESG